VMDNYLDFLRSITLKQKLTAPRMEAQRKKYERATTRRSESSDEQEDPRVLECGARELRRHVLALRARDATRRGLLGRVQGDRGRGQARRAGGPLPLRR